MKTVVPIRNKQAVKEFINFTNQLYLEAEGKFGPIAANIKGMKEYMERLGYEGDIDELIKDMITQHHKTPLFERQGKMRTVGYCYTPAFAAIYKLEKEMIMVPILAPGPILVDNFPVH